MKKIIFAAAIGVGAVVSSYAQGKVNFQNYYSSTQVTGISYASGPDAGKYVGPEMSAILLYGDSTATSIGQLTALAASSTPLGLGVATGPDVLGTGAGWFNGGAFVIPSIGSASPGGTYAFAIEVIGGGYIGYSPIALGTTAATASSPTPYLPDALYKGSFTVSPVPEPATLALAGLGGFGMLMALRRKKA